jgi:hypothetical protein
MQKVINMLILQGYPEDKDEEVQRLLLEAVPNVKHQLSFHKKYKMPMWNTQPKMR